MTCPISLSEKLLCRGESATIFRKADAYEDKSEKVTSERKGKPKLSKVDMNIGTSLGKGQAAAVGSLGVEGAGMKTGKKKKPSSKL